MACQSGALVGEHDAGSTVGNGMGLYNSSARPGASNFEPVFGGHLCLASWAEDNALGEVCSMVSVNDAL